jgi:hypothetical protein
VTAPKGLIRAATLVSAEIQRSGIGDEEPEASFDCFSAGVAGGGAGASAGAASAAAGGAVTGAAAGGWSCVHATKESATIAAGTKRASFAMCEPQRCRPRAKREASAAASARADRPLCGNLACLTT